MAHVIDSLLVEGVGEVHSALRIGGQNSILVTLLVEFCQTIQCRLPVEANDDEVQVLQKGMAFWASIWRWPGRFEGHFFFAHLVLCAGLSGILDRFLASPIRPRAARIADNHHAFAGTPLIRKPLHVFIALFDSGVGLAPADRLWLRTGSHLRISTFAFSNPVKLALAKL